MKKKLKINLFNFKITIKFTEIHLFFKNFTLINIKIYNNNKLIFIYYQIYYILKIHLLKKFVFLLKISFLFYN